MYTPENKKDPLKLRSIGSRLQPNNPDISEVTFSLEEDLCFSYDKRLFTREDIERHARKVIGTLVYDEIRRNITARLATTLAEGERSYLLDLLDLTAKFVSGEVE